jgi:PD-(D/E)XK endonuclease
MRWKKNRLAGGNLQDHGQRGEWAELYFMMQAAGLAMRVSRPFGDSGKYDVGVEGHGVKGLGRVSKVQVKSTNYRLAGGSFSVNVSTSQGKRYEPGTVDFFAILLIPIDSWYIIPFEAMEAQGTNLYFPPTCTTRYGRNKYWQYREAWHLLKETGLTIQACIDPDWPEVNEEEVRQELEARVGIEPTHKGFADLSLTTWVPRPW